MATDFSIPQRGDEATAGGFAGGVRGILVSFADNGSPIVDFPNNASSGPVIAQTTVSLSQADLGREVVLLFEDQDPRHPIILGVIKATQVLGPPAGEVSLDGRVLTLTAEREIVLRCGEASITLTRDGKVLIKGSYLLSKSTGVNRIKGGSVELN